MNKHTRTPIYMFMQILELKIYFTLLGCGHVKNMPVCYGHLTLRESKDYQLRANSAQGHEIHSRQVLFWARAP